MRLLPQPDRPIDPLYAFCLGYEMAKAVTALTLGKTCRQDEGLDCGLLTVPEPSRLEQRAARMARQGVAEGQSEADREPCG